MLNLANIQTTVATAIGAASYFTTAPSVSCIVDDGYQEREIEAALRTRGFVLVVPPLLRIAFKDQGISKTFTGEADVFVRVLCNAKVNAATGAAQRNVNEAVKQAILAVLSWTPTAGDRRFMLADSDSVVLSVIEEGLLAYDIFFRKQISIN